MSQAPDITVITATYRRPAQVQDALRSALGQTGVRIEVIVVDDCPDGSARTAVAELGDDRVQYLRMARPTGGRRRSTRRACTSNCH